jgi:hypothetical protein
MHETSNDLIVNKKNPAQEPIQMLALLQYVFTLNKLSVGSRIGTIVYRHGRGHPKALDAFLAGTLSLAHRPIPTLQEVN